MTAAGSAPPPDRAPDATAPREPEARRADAALNVFASPADETAPPSPEPVALEPGHYAGFGVRAGGRLLDYLASAMLTGVAGGCSGVAYVLLKYPFHKGSQAQNWFVGAILALIFHTTFEGLFGASPGKILVRVRVLQEDGRPCTFQAAFVRNLAFFVDAFLFGLVAARAMESSPRAQRHGDRWARTVVVQSSAVPAASRRSPSLFVSATVVTFILEALVLFAFHLGAE